jgi:hypothetical protein
VDTTWLEGLATFLAVPTGIWGLYAACVRTNRKNDFERKANQIRLKTMEAQAKLDLKLHEWQQTKSLEDLERHRRRLESQLDEMHGDMDS